MDDFYTFSKILFFHFCKKKCHFSNFAGEGATIQNVPPIKAPNGADGVNPGDSGLSGDAGANAFSMVLEANKLLQGSADQIIFISQVSHCNTIIFSFVAMSTVS